MPHAVFRDQLVALANNNASDAGGFLEGLSDIHDNWHGEFVRTYGFLLFHHRVVRYFSLIVNSQLQPAVAPFTANDFQQMGVQAFAPNLANIDTLPELARFAGTVEAWHNSAHSQIGISIERL